jgi:peptidyl-dipeptidase Dcp
MKTNSVLKSWVGRSGGVPAFDQINIDDFIPALKVAIDENRKEILAIVENPNTPNFDNTIVAFEKSGATLDRVMKLVGVWQYGLSDSRFQKIEQEFNPIVSAFHDEVIQNEKLFLRVDQVSKSAELKTLTPEDQRLVYLVHHKFVRNGGMLKDEQKTKIAAINLELSKLQTQFSQNILADEAEYNLTIEDQNQLAGLPNWVLDTGSESAKKLGKTGWVFSNTRTVIEALLTYGDNRDLRERAFRIFVSRGDQNNKNDNNKLVSEILRLRTEKAKILGFKTFADWQLSDKMAKTPEEAMRLMMLVWPHAVRTFEKDVQEMASIARNEGMTSAMEPWDYRFYAEKLRAKKLDLNMEVVKPYLRLENLMAAMFDMAKNLYGFEFKEVQDVPVFASNMSVYEISRKGAPVGLFYFDLYARTGKYSGAWMTSYRDQHRQGQKNITVLVSNNSNFSLPATGKPTLLSWDDAITLFHEFGHGLHGISSNVKYNYVSGTNVTMDFVELPSQFHENYLETNEVLNFLKNEKGDSLPYEMIEKLKSVRNFGEGFRSVEFLASSILDMKLHSLETHPVNPRDFEKSALAELGMPHEVVMRHRLPHFSHIFASDAYAAGYYSYLWADVLKHDAFEAFMENGGAFDRQKANSFFDEILSVGNSVAPEVAYRNFRGRDPHTDALLRARGFSSPR